MRIFPKQKRYTPKSPKKVQIIMYLVAMSVLLIALLPFSVIFSPAGGLAISFLMMAVLVGWMQWRINRLQVRMHKAEQQLRRLASQKALTTIQPQSVSHLEPESFFSRDQTRHWGVSSAPSATQASPAWNASASLAVRLLALRAGSWSGDRGSEIGDWRQKAEGGRLMVCRYESMQVCQWAARSLREIGDRWAAELVSSK